jgi:hypothetical protein
MIVMSPSAMAEVNLILDGMTRKIWHLLITFLRAGLHAPPEELSVNIPTICEDYCGTAIRSWTQLLNDEGTLGVTTRASLCQASTKFNHCPVKLAVYTHNGHATCPSVIGRNVATLLTVDLYPMGDMEIRASNHRSASLAAKIPITMVAAGCPKMYQPFPQPTKIMQRLVPLWAHLIHD